MPDLLTDCILWTAARNRAGYGVVRIAGKTHLAHRIVLEKKLGRALAAGMFSLHHCDTPPCINPGHLYEGTREDNANDMVARNRQYRGDTHWTKTPEGRENRRAAAIQRRKAGGSFDLKGSDAPWAKLTEDRVREARRRSMDGESAASIAKGFGVHREVMRKAIVGETWKHVQEGL
jgi:hypothetical protein